MKQQRLKTAFALSWGVLALAVVQSAAAVASPGVYRDVLWIRSTFHGQDWVTLVAAAPILALALVLARRGSIRAHLVWLGALAYMVYNYAYYALGAIMNQWSMLYIALVVVADAALIYALLGTDAEKIRASFSARTPVRIVAGYLLVVGGVLAAIWISKWAAMVFRGVIPNVGEAPFRLVATADLTLLVPGMMLGGVWLWQKRAWGYVVAALAAVQGALYTTSLIGGSLANVAAGTPGAASELPIWIGLTVGGALASAALILGAGRVDPSHAVAKRHAATTPS